MESMQNSVDIANLVLAIASICLSGLAIILSLVFFFKASGLNRETFGFLQSLRTLTASVYEFQKDMILPVWERSTRASSSHDLDKTREDLEKQFEAKIEAVLEEVRSTYEEKLGVLSPDQQRAVTEYVEAVVTKTAESAASDRIQHINKEILHKAREILGEWERDFDWEPLSWPVLVQMMKRRRPTSSLRQISDAVFRLIAWDIVESTTGPSELTATTVLTPRTDGWRIFRERLAGKHE